MRASLATRLHSVAIHLLRRVRREDRASGLSPSRLSALSVVVFGGPASLGELAAAEQVTPPTMSRIVTALEEDGLVVREPDPDDGRAVRIRETDRGRRLLEAARDRRVELLSGLLGDLAEDEVAAIARAVGLLEDVLEGSSEGSAAEQVA